MGLTKIKTGGLTDNSVTDAKVADAITVTGAQTGITSVGTLAGLSSSDDVVLNNNKYFEVKDSGGSAIRLLGLDNSNNIYMGFVDDATGTGSLYLRTGGTNALSLDNSQDATFASWVTVTEGLIVNESGGDNDVRMESQNNDNIFRIDASTDRIGIGTGSPAAFVDIQLSAQIPGISVYNNDSTNSYGIDIAAGNDANDYILRARDRSGAVKAIINGDGAVGIGTASPTDYSTSADNLVIYDANHAGITIASPTDKSGNLFFADGTSGDAEYRGFIQYDHGNNATDVMSIGTAGAEKMRIDNLGNVGIGSSGSNLNARIVRGFSANKGLVIETQQPAIQLVDTDNTGRYFTIAYEQSSKTAFIHNQSNGPIRFDTNESVRMTIAGDGRIAMGTTDTSLASLTVQRATNSTDDSVYPIVLARNENDTGNSYAGFKAVGRIDSSNQVSLFLLADGANSLGFVGTNTNNTFQVRTNGSVSISCATNQVASGDFNDTSDIGYKENVATIKDGIEIVNQLNPVTFDWKNKDKGSSAGVIAQELEKILPDLVYGENYDKSKPDIMGKAVSTSGLVGYLIKAVQELSAKVTALENL